MDNFKNICGICGEDIEDEEMSIIFSIKSKNGETESFKACEDCVYYISRFQEIGLIKVNDKRHNFSLN